LIASSKTSVTYLFDETTVLSLVVVSLTLAEFTEIEVYELTWVTWSVFLIYETTSIRVTSVVLLLSTTTVIVLIPYLVWVTTS
jgi:hypothetical protein